jgi:hypothetical protein
MRAPSRPDVSNFIVDQLRYYYATFDTRETPQLFLDLLEKLQKADDKKPKDNQAHGTF